MPGKSTPVLNKAHDTTKSAFDFIGNAYYYNGNPYHDTFLKPIVEKPINQLMSEELFFLIRDFDKNIQFFLPPKADDAKNEQIASVLKFSIFNSDEPYYQFFMLLNAMGERGKNLVQNGQADVEDAQSVVKMINNSPFMQRNQAMLEYKSLLESCTQNSRLSMDYKR